MKKKTVKKAKKAPKILSRKELPPVRVENVRGRGTGVVICDHGSNRVPSALKGLGIRKSDLQKHIAWDIGAEDISRYVSKALDMPVVLASYSRLVTDLNRAPYYHECMAAESDNIKVPANTNLSKEAWEGRLQEIYWPYQNQIGKQVDRFVKKGRVPLLIAIHSYTPELSGQKRPWHLAVLWHKEAKIAKELIRNLRKNHPDLLVGENEPYTLFNERFANSTMWRHAEQRGLPYVFIEFRQDLVNTKERAARWAEIFLQALRPILETPEFFQGRTVKPLKK